MSTALAIASVTQVLKDLLNDGLINNDVTGALGTTVSVTATSPDRIDTSVANEQSQLNLFMYQVSINTGWRNNGLPSHSASGDRISNPPLALDLHYLLTAYGASELHPEILLGYGMQLLHETPVLVREAIRKSLTGPFTNLSLNNLPLSLRALSSSKLAEQVEQIKITPEQLSAEELSKFWTAFQAKYRPTAAYRVTVVLIETTKSVKSALPVKQRKLYVQPFNQPVISKIKSQASLAAPVLEDQKILSGYRMILEGDQLVGEVVKVNIDGLEIASPIEIIDNIALAFVLPNTIPAGVHGVQVNHPVLMGEPPVLHQGVVSVAEPFILSPQVVNIQVSNITGTGVALRSADVALKVSPGIGMQQKVNLLLNEFSNGAAIPVPHSYSFPLVQASPLSPVDPVEDIVVSIKNVAAGSYLVRIQVDGAESPLGADPNGKYNSPQLVII